MARDHPIPPDVRVGAVLNRLTIPVRCAAASGPCVSCGIMTSLMTWLTPAAGPVRDHLAATIGRLADLHNAPRFQPHITLAPAFETAADAALAVIRSAAVRLSPVEVTFAAIRHEQTYFRSLYLIAEPSAQLAAFHEAARKAWALDTSWSFMPHLSLLYSDISDEEKRSIIDTIGIPLPLAVRFDALELWVRDDPEVAHWYRAGRAPFPRW